MISGHKIVRAKQAVLVVSSDPVVAAQLRIFLEGAALETRIARSFSEAEVLLESSDLRAIFIDLRFTSLEENPTKVLENLARRNGNRIPCVSLGGDGYDPAWAHIADLAIDTTLNLPLNEYQFREFLASENFVKPAHRSPQLTTPWVIETGNFKYVTYTPEMYQMLDHLVMMATHDVTLLLIGETGTGKTTVARMIHELSPRRHDPFLTVACGSLPPDLIESELFGHTRGAFTSADRSKIGKFEAAAGGSLLLDEIDVLGANQQTKLLRIIETGEFELVGCNETRRSNARLIVASNVDLKGLMERDEFRPDLYYRLNVLEFRIPPLRHRLRDIVPLTLGFIEEFKHTHAITVRRIQPDFLQALKQYSWPGNLRELKNHIRRAVLFCRNGELTVKDLAPSLFQANDGHTATISNSRTPTTLFERVASTEQEILEAALRAHGYKRTTTAQSLGISRVGLYKKMKKYGMLTAKREPNNRLPTNVSDKPASYPTPQTGASFS